jgi:hypothetical protein
MTAADVVGCWAVVRPSTASPSDSAFWSAPVRLDTVLGASLLSPDSRHPVHALAQLPDSLASDTALMKTTWHLVAPDTLVIVRSSGFFGSALRLRLAGDQLSGVERTFTDLPDEIPSVEHAGVKGQRVPCPATGRA